MTKIFNEKGITLIELLAALALFGVIAVLLWNLFFQALNFNDRAVTQNQLQQEANIILNTIQKMHTEYTIIQLINENNSTSSSFIIKGKKKNDLGNVVSKEEKFENAQIIYNVTINEIKPIGKIFEDSLINPVTEFDLSLTLTSKQDPKIKYKTKTTFSKLTGKN